MGPVEKRIQNGLRRYGAICFTLIDHENITPGEATKIAITAENCGAAAILVGGSTANDQISLDALVRAVKKAINIPVILFPANVTSISPNADAILFSSLLNSDNPYFISQAQALGATLVKKYALEAIPMGYLIMGEGGTAGFIGKARGLPLNKPSIAVMYSLAAQYMGMRFLYLEAGSGVTSHIPKEIIIAVRKNFDGVLMVGGGIKRPEDAETLSSVGVDILIVGTLMERNQFKEPFERIIDATRTGSKKHVT